MEIIKEFTRGLFLIKPKIFADNRGYFAETYNKEAFRALGLEADFVQDNESMSQKGTIRGLHFQKPPYSQLKLIRVVSGAVFDVAVDIRKDSATYGKWYGVELTCENKQMFWIPSGFAHGFQALEDNTVFQYKCSNFYHVESENSILWNDPDINIRWVDNIKPVISEKDSKAQPFATFHSLF
ncbi:MAG: dTDP-4-dehydrorhamnose 3,5-epimerase [Bacteroidales bacterium]|nr:dTDP-4-dehydrorhamnose 3,5-epimerase [Bacteroidales bacterium]